MTRPDRINFNGRVRHRQIGLVGITDVRASAMRASRTAATIARAPSDDLIVVLHLSGTCHAAQRSLSEELASHGGAMVATDDRYVFDFPHGFRQLVLKLPRCLLAEERIASVARGSLRLTAGPARLLERLASSSLADPDVFSPDETVGIERAFADLLRSAIIGSRDDADDRIGALRYAEACRYIRQHLADSSLRPADVAAYMRTSTRSLARLFAEKAPRSSARSGADAWLQRGATSKTPDCRTTSITEIAFSWAFNDAGHFSRSFSAACGLSPSAFRAAFSARRRN